MHELQRNNCVDVIDPQGPDPYLYCLGTWTGYTITLDKYPDQVLWTRNGIRGRSRVWVDITTMCVYDYNGPNANKKTNARIVVRYGEHSEEELPPIVEPLLDAEQRGCEITCGNRTIKLDSGIRGRQAMLVGPDGTIFFGVGPNYGMVYEGVKMPMNAQTVSARHQVTASTNQTRKPAMAKKQVKKETPKHPELPGLESASASLLKLKRTVSSEPEFFKYFNKASGIYLDAISGLVPSFEDVSEALMDVNTELKQCTDPNVAKQGKIFFEAFRDFRNSYKEWLMNNNKTTASHKALASEKVWIAASPKGGNVSDPVATKALEKYISEFGKRGKLRLYEAYRENGMAVYRGDCKSFKGTLQEILDQLKQEAIAQAKSNTSSVVVAEETYSNKAAGQIYGDVKAIAAKLKSWKKSMTKEEYAQYEDYQKGVLKYILTNVLSKLPEEYQTKIKAI